MKFPNKEIVEKIKNQYPKGMRIELVKMDDPQAPPIGTKGTIVDVDDIGTIFIHWDNGSKLGIIYGVDDFKVIK